MAPADYSPRRVADAEPLDHHWIIAGQPGIIYASAAYTYDVITAMVADRVQEQGLHRMEWHFPARDS